MAFPRHFEAWKEVSLRLLHRSLIACRCGHFRRRFWPEIRLYSVFVVSRALLTTRQDGGVTWWVIFHGTATEVSRLLALQKTEQYTLPLPAVPSQWGIDALHTRSSLWCVQGLVARSVGSVRESSSTETQSSGGSEGSEEKSRDGRLHWNPRTRRRNSSPARQMQGWRVVQDEEESGMSHLV